MNLRDQLLAIYDQHEELTPALVVSEAREEAHPLHDRFEWDDSVAGESWRLHQAHELIRLAKVVYRPSPDKSKEEKVRAFHAVRREDGFAYEPAEKVVTNPLLREMVLRDMRRDWERLRARYEQFEEFAAMVRGDLGDEAA